MTAFPEPTEPAAASAEVFLRYLDYFRDKLIDKIEALPAAELRHSRLRSGWTPLELLQHLTFVEQRPRRRPSWPSAGSLRSL